jgi:hypothetical protein
VSSCLPAYSFVLTPFKALGSLPSPQSDGSLNGYLGFPNAEAGPSSFVSTSLLAERACSPSSIIDPTTRPLVSTQHRRGCGPQSTYLRAPSLVYGGQQRGWANATSFRPTSQPLERHFVCTLLPVKRDRPSKKIPRFPVPWDFTQPTDHLATPTEALAPMVTSEVGPSTSLGKRSRQRYETYSYGCLAG